MIHWWKDAFRLQKQAIQRPWQIPVRRRWLLRFSLSSFCYWNQITWIFTSRKDYFYALYYDYHLLFFSSFMLCCLAKSDHHIIKPGKTLSASGSGSGRHQRFTEPDSALRLTLRSALTSLPNLCPFTWNSSCFITIHYYPKFCCQIVVKCGLTSWF